MKQVEAETEKKIITDPAEVPEEIVSTLESEEEIEQIGKDIVVGRKTVDYEDGRNIISVIINAISVRINMPRGTVKVLMACFVILLASACVYLVSVLHSWNAPYKETAEYQRAVESIKDAIEYGSYYTGEYAYSRVEILPEKEVAISENYSYIVPAGYYIEYPYMDGEWFVNAQAYSFYNGSGDWYLARTYITKLDIDSKDLETIVLERLKDAYDVRNIRYEYADFDIGRVLVCRYEIVESGEPDVFAVEYSWADDDGTICSLEISTIAGDYEETAWRVMDSVHRSRNAFTNDELVERDIARWEEEEDYIYDEDFDPEEDPYDPFMNDVDPYEAALPSADEARRQQAMEAWEKYNRPETDPSDGVIKP